MVQIGELAKSAAVTVQAVRFYERRGLLPAPRRTESGYRIYSQADVRRLQFIRQAKWIGFSLNEIQSILQMRERATCPCEEVVGYCRETPGRNGTANQLSGSIP